MKPLENRPTMIKYHLNDLKLHAAKQIINAITRPLWHAIPKTKPKHKISLLTDEILRRLIDSARKDKLLETGDTNFVNLLRASKKALVFMSETDEYYRNQLAFLYLTVWKHMNAVYDDFKPGDVNLPFKDWEGVDKLTVFESKWAGHLPNVDIYWSEEGGEQVDEM